MVTFLGWIITFGVNYHFLGINSPFCVNQHFWSTLCSVHEVKFTKTSEPPLLLDVLPNVIWFDFIKVQPKKVLWSERMRHLEMAWEKWTMCTGWTRWTLCTGWTRWQDEHCALGEQEHYWIRRCDVKVYSVTKSRHDFTIPHNWVHPIIYHKLRSWRANKVGHPQS